MVWQIAAPIAAAGVSSLANFFGQQSANQASADMARATTFANATMNQVSRRFAAQQNRIARKYNTHEAKKSRNFNQTQAWLAHKRQLAANTQLQQNSMDFSERMASTQHQRAVEDMKAAGINPIMAAGTPNAAPTGTGATVASTQASASPASASPASAGSAGGAVSSKFENALGPAAASAMSAFRLGQEIKNMRQDVEESKAREDNTKAAERRTNAETNVLFEKYRTEELLQKEVEERTKAHSARAALDAASARIAQYREAGEMLESQFDQSPVGEVSRFIKRFSPFASSAKSVLR